jgi:hypothetical protein
MTVYTRFFLFRLVLFSKQVLIAVGNNAIDVAHARVAHVYAVSIENLVEARYGNAYLGKCLSSS